MGGDLVSSAGESASGAHLKLASNRVLFVDNFTATIIDSNPATVNPLDGVWRLWSCWRDTDNSCGITLNTVSEKTGSYAGTFGFTGNLQIGRRSAAEAGYLTGTEGEVIIYNRKLSSSERTKVYLATKWRYV